jgi:hypothetical protein
MPCPRNRQACDLSVEKGERVGFETSYRRALYPYGFDKAKTGDFWAKAPPSDDPVQNGFRYRRPAAQP